MTDLFADLPADDTGPLRARLAAAAAQRGLLDVAYRTLDSPLGSLLLAATPAGLVRAVFDDHVEADTLRALAGPRRGGAAAREHLADATAFLDAYFADAPSPAACIVDWDALGNASTPTLQSVQAIGSGLDCSYETLRGGAGAHERGLALGTNPIALVVPCHRVTRGREVTEAYVGGTERKRWLRRHEQR